MEKEKSIGLILGEIEIRSILARRQSQLRRLAGVLKMESVDVIWGKEVYRESLHSDGYDDTGAEKVHVCPAYRGTGTYRCGKPMVYDLEDTTRTGFWVPAYLMPRKLSRLILHVERILDERLGRVALDPQAAGSELWQLFAANWDQEHTNPGEKWSDNPMVTVVQFHLEEL